MTIPNESYYPKKLDSDINLFEVHDALRVTLSQDYEPGDLSITIEGDNSNFPNQGFITLVEQCNDPNQRSLTLYYESKTSSSFDNLSYAFGSNLYKPKRFTNVVRNVMAQDHNILKDAIINIEKFVGIKDDITNAPGVGTIEGRLNLLRNLTFRPKAWFSVNKRIGLVETEGLKCTFTDESIRTGSGTVTYIWDFGDSNPSDISVISTFSTTSIVPTDTNVLKVVDLNGGQIEKTYTKPGIYDVSLRIINEFGEDIVTFPRLIEARISAPEPSIISFITNSSQILTPGDPINGPFNTYPIIRTPVNTFINLEVQDGENLSTPGYSYAGEKLNNNDEPIDPITTWTWFLTDDLIHNNLRYTKASYSIGGIYDLKLRVDTEFGSYRITTYENVIDVVENKNLWLFTINGSQIRSYEFGLISQVFKSAMSTQTISRDDSFLNGTGDETRAKREFNRNVGFVPKGTTGSGLKGNCLIFYAGGGSDYNALGTQQIKFLEFNGFLDIYSTDESLYLNRPWNWLFFGDNNKAYFTFGPNPTKPLSQNPTYEVVSKFSLMPNLSYNNSTDDTTLVLANYLNGSQELRNNVTLDYSGGEPTSGRFSVYRSCWKDSTGYFLRNDNVGTLFKIKSFYKTEGIVANPFINIRKLNDISGEAKKEGQLVNLSNGLFFFNNTSKISYYNDITNVWTEGGPTGGVSSFRQLQDQTVSGFDNSTNTLLATSDSENNAYISYDYSENSFIKYDSNTNIFQKLVSRPTGEQFIMGVY